VEATGALPNIVPKANRRWRNCFSPSQWHRADVPPRRHDDHSRRTFSPPSVSPLHQLLVRTP